MERDPCPDRIVMDCGAAFTIGMVGGSAWHGFKGMRMNPKGMKLHGALAAIRAKAPTTGGSFAVWGGLFSTFDCTLAHLRGTEDPLNPILSGAITGGVLAARSGFAAAGKSALIGGALLALIEGVNFMLMRSLPGADPTMMRPEDHLAPVEIQQPYVSAEDYQLVQGHSGAGDGQQQPLDYDNMQSFGGAYDAPPVQVDSGGSLFGGLPEWAKELEEPETQQGNGFLGSSDWKKDKWDSY